MILVLIILLLLIILLAMSDEPPKLLSKLRGDYSLVLVDLSAMHCFRVVS